MNYSTLNPKSDPAADELAVIVKNAQEAVQQLQNAVALGKQSIILDRCENVRLAVYSLADATDFTLEVILDTIKIVEEHGPNICWGIRPMLALEVVSAIRRQIELVVERITE